MRIGVTLAILMATTSTALAGGGFEIVIRYIDPVPNVGHYYPSAGRIPGYGRLEIEPPANRRLPQPAESYHQSWSAQSAPLPAQSNVPVNPPEIIYAPGDDRSRSPGDDRSPDRRRRGPQNLPR
jgi:hypothetical protein